MALHLLYTHYIIPFSSYNSWYSKFPQVVSPRWFSSCTEYVTSGQEGIYRLFISSGENRRVLSANGYQSKWNTFTFNCQTKTVHKNKANNSITLCTQKKQQHGWQLVWGFYQFVLCLCLRQYCDKTIKRFSVFYRRFN